MKINFLSRQVAMAALVCFTVGVFGLGYLFQQGVINRNRVPVEQAEMIKMDGIENISVTTDISSITFVKSQSAQMRVSLTGEVSEADREYARININHSGNSVSIKGNSGKSFTMGLDINRLYNIFNNKVELTVELPEATYKSLKIRSNTGSILMGTVHAEKLDIGSDTGSVAVGGFTGKQLKVNTATGSIELGDVTGALDVDSDTGSVQAKLIRLTDSSNINTATGSIRISIAEPLALDLDFASETGRTTVQGAGGALQLSKDQRQSLKGTLSGGGPLLKIRSDTGRIELTVR